MKVIVKVIVIVIVIVTVIVIGTVLLRQVGQPDNFRNKFNNFRGTIAEVSRRHFLAMQSACHKNLWLKEL